MTAILTLTPYDSTVTKLSDTEVVFDENAPDQKIIATLTPVDGTTGDPVLVSSYEFYVEAGDPPLPLDGGGRYTLDGNKLVVNNLSQAAFDYEDVAHHIIRIQAKDAGGNVIADQTFRLDLSDQNEAPSAPILFSSSVNEAAPNDTIVGDLYSDDPEHSSVTYRFASGGDAGGRFKIENGQIKVADGTAIDYESLPAGQKFYTVTVIASDGVNDTTQSFNINVNDMAEGPGNKAPTHIRWTTPPDAVAENATSGVVGTITADDDGGASGLRYSVSDANFTIDAVTGQVSVKSGAALNYEAGSTVTLAVTATDTNGTGLSTTSNVTVTLKDVNEAPTTVSFTNGQTSAALQADTAAGAITTAAAADPDTANPEYQNNKYRFADGTTSAYDGLFTIDASTGQISTTRTVTSADIGQKMLQVVAYDSTDGSLVSSAATYTVTVTAANNLPPSNIRFADTDAVSIIIDENTTAVGTVTATDSDTLTYAFAAGGNGNGLFAIDPNTGTISLETGVNYEAIGPSKYFDLVVLVSDGVNAAVQQQLRVNINDVNEKPTGIELSAKSVSSTAAGGTLIGILTSTDPDAGFVPAYSIAPAGDPGNLFQVNNDQLQVRSDATLTPGRYNVILRVTDQGDLTFDKTFEITVNDANTNQSPLIGGVPFGTQTVQDRATLQPFATMTIADVGTLTVEVSGFAGKGVLTSYPANAVYNEATGTLVFQGDAAAVTQALQSLVFDAADKAAGSEAETTLFTIKVKDAEGLESSQDVQVTATAPDAVNHAPSVVLTGGGAVQELAGPGTLVATFAAKDADGDSLTYAVVGDGRFYFEGTQLKVANGALIDYEAAQSLNLTVRVSDGHTAPVDSAVAIRVDDRVETLLGTKAKNVLTGGLGADILKGGYGNDTLKGQGGADAFVFDAKPGTAATDRKVNFDKILDFKVGEDKLWLDNKYFKKLGKGTEAAPGALKKAFFVIGDKAKDKDDYLIYNKKTGVLSYDADGSGAGEAVELAQLAKNLKLSVKDIFVI